MALPVSTHSYVGRRTLTGVEPSLRILKMGPETYLIRIGHEGRGEAADATSASNAHDTETESDTENDRETGTKTGDDSKSEEAGPRRRLGRLGCLLAVAATKYERMPSVTPLLNEGSDNYMEAELMARRIGQVFDRPFLVAYDLPEKTFNSEERLDFLGKGLDVIRACLAS